MHYVIVYAIIGKIAATIDIIGPPCHTIGIILTSIYYLLLLLLSVITFLGCGNTSRWPLN